MTILYIHNSVPGQFANLIAHRADRVRPRSVFLSAQDNAAFTLVERRLYTPDALGTPGDRALEPAARILGHARAAARALRRLVDDGFRPMAIVAHPAWGSVLPVRDVLPDVPLVVYCEHYNESRGAAGALANWHVRAALDAADALVTPTEWQRSIFPADARPRIETIHDGIDTSRLRPDPLARFELPDGTTVGRGDQLVTYVARGLEPTRGFPELIRAVPTILRGAPDARIAIVGGERAIYGPEPEGGGSHKAAMLRETGLTDRRVHFLGQIRYADFIRLMQVSTVHVYPSRRFVLSWSVLEAMSIGAVVVGADNAPVREVIEDGVTGLLADPGDAAALADRIVAVLRDPPRFAAIGRAARDMVIARYDVARCMARWIALLRQVAPGIS